MLINNQSIVSIILHYLILHNALKQCSLYDWKVILDEKSNIVFIIVQKQLDKIFWYEKCYRRPLYSM